MLLPAGDAEFDDVNIGDPNLKNEIKATCTDGADFNSEALTMPIVVHDWPELTMVRKTSVGMKYEGPKDPVLPTINAFNEVMVEGQDTITVTDLETSGNEVVIIDLSKFHKEAMPLLLRTEL